MIRIGLLLRVTAFCALSLCRNAYGSELTKLREKISAESSVAKLVLKGVSVDTIQDRSGVRYIRLAPYKVSGYRGVLTLGFLKGKLNSCFWHLDSIAEWIVPPKNLDSAVLESYKHPSRREFDIVSQGLTKSLGPAELVSNDSLIVMRWKSGENIRYILRTKRIFYSDSEIDEPILETYFDASNWGGLKNYDAKVAQVLDRKCITDSVATFSSGSQFRTIEQYDSVWGIPGKTMYSIDHDSRLFGASWIADPRYYNEYGAGRMIRTLSLRFGSPAQVGNSFVHWDFSGGAAEFQQHRIIAQVVFVRADAKSIVDGK
jgi:hypothetical protein